MHQSTAEIYKGMCSISKIFSLHSFHYFLDTPIAPFLRNNLETHASFNHISGMGSSQFLTKSPCKISCYIKLKEGKKNVRNTQNNLAI